jgi:hypothetical protein
MRSRDSAFRFMERVGVEESLIGDLAEQRRTGRSALWLWRQTVIAVAQRFEVIAQQDPTRLGIEAGVVALALAAVRVDALSLALRGLAGYGVVSGLNELVGSVVTACGLAACSFSPPMGMDVHGRMVRHARRHRMVLGSPQPEPARSDPCCFRTFERR